MSYMRLIISLLLCSVFVIGCAMEDGAVGDSDTVESVIIGDTTTPETAVSTESEATVQSCYRAWDCHRCSNGTWRNVFVEFCDDGSETIISSGPCGQDCF